MKSNEHDSSRRRFLENAALIGAVGTLGAGQVLSSCTRKPLRTDLKLPPLLEVAPDGDLIRAGVIGCGGRGTGAALDFLNAGPNLQVVALADIFQDRIDECRTALKENKGVDIPGENCHTGFDSFRKVIESEVDLVILATPPYFRPLHFSAAVEARKHVFIEKPVAVDPVGARSVMASSRKAEAAGLCVVSGTQRRHQHDYIECYRQVMNGAIGKLVSANCYWNQSHLWYRERKTGWSDMEFMLRDWVNWLWLSGDHIVEQHIHNIDVINWYMGAFPVKATGFGSRHRRVTGNQYDNFSVDYVYEGNIHLHSMSRQIDDCANNVSEFLRGTEGYTNCRNKIFAPDGKLIWEYAYPVDQDGNPAALKISSQVQEHIDLVTAIRTGKQVVESEDTARSTLTAIMGRISAYTGKDVSWEEVMQSDLVVTAPAGMVIGDVGLDVSVPVPGSAPK